MNRILVIRGGAIGDFILTLPALKALRDAHPQARVEILGYKHIAALADNRYYAQAVRSIEYGSLSAFFAKNSELPAELANYFASFDLLISYLYDPDRVFENNLRRCSVENFVLGPARLDTSAHAARQLARPIEQLGIKTADFAAKIFLSAQDRHFAEDFLKDLPHPIVAIHPGSGSERKNWPTEKWIALGANRFNLVVVSGEADEAERTVLEREWQNRHPLVRFARNLPLPRLAAVLERTIFIGHDSGISHLAAAVGANCILLFGPTNPAVWAPLNENVRVLCAPDGNLHRLQVDVVHNALTSVSARSGVQIFPATR